MSEIRSISEGTFVIGDTNGLTFEAGPGISVSQPSEGTVRIANDETVLWSGTYQGTGSITLSEALSNFDLVRIEWSPYTEPANWLEPKDSVTTKVFDNTIHLTGVGISTDYTYEMLVNIALQVNSTTITELYHGSVTLHSTAAVGNTRGYKIFKVVGINRITGGNNE